MRKISKNSEKKNAFTKIIKTATNPKKINFGKIKLKTSKKNIEKSFLTKNRRKIEKNIATLFKKKKNESYENCQKPTKNNEKYFKEIKRKIEEEKTA